MTRLTGADAQSWLAAKQAEHEALMSADIIDDRPVVETPKQKES